MTFYIIIQRSNGSEKAIAAFSSMRRTEDFLKDSATPETRIDEYEVPRGVNFSTVMMYANHKRMKTVPAKSPVIFSISTMLKVKSAETGLFSDWALINKIVTHHKVTPSKAHTRDTR